MTTIDKNGYDELGRPSWDLYFISLAFMIAQKSIDPNTKHGCVLVSKYNKILSTGYNGPLIGVDDNKVPLTRPSKYYVLLHAEENCLLSYNGSLSDLEGSRIYVTGEPCYKCLRMIIQKGIKNVIYGHVGSKCIDNDDILAKKIMTELIKDLKIEKYKEVEKLEAFLDNTMSYINKKAIC